MKLLLHPLPVRVFHWTMFAAVMTLFLTGLYLHSPPAWLLLPVSLMRGLHGAAAAVLVVNFAGQIYYYAYTGKHTEILLLPGDWANMRSFLRYYLFVTEHHPNFGRYNPGQKALFSAWGLAVAVAAVTGAALLFPDDTTRLQRLLGGLNACRSVHFLVAAFFAASIPFHLYLVFTEEPAKLQAIFTGYVRKEPQQPPAGKAP
jgi:Ni/Fe-hydrogenase 1 B-type cytochrome subunit